MKKRLLAILAVIAVLACALLLPTAAAEPTFQAGFGQVDITPAANSGLPLVRYGTEDVVMNAVDADSKLYTSCVAVTDAQGTTALFLSVDTINSNQLWSNAVKDGIVTAYPQIDSDRIYISATGTMSAPETVYSGTDSTRAAAVENYKKTLITACIDAAKAAMEDLTPVTMQQGGVDVSDTLTTLKGSAATTLNTRMNWNAYFYATKDGVTQVSADGVGPAALNDSTYTLEEVATPSDAMGLIRFVPTDTTKTPIVLVNWSANPDLSSSGYTRYGKENRGVASADYVGYFRNALEYGTLSSGKLTVGQTRNSRALFLQGASGNVNAFSLNRAKWDSDVVTGVAFTDENGVQQTEASVTPKLYGEKLALVAASGLQSANMADKTNTIIKNLMVRFAAEPDVPTDTQVSLVNKMKSFGPVTVDNGNGTTTSYTTLFEYIAYSTANMLNGRGTYVTVANGFTEAEISALGAMKSVIELWGVETRMSHEIRTRAVVNQDGTITTQQVNTNFATDAVISDVTVLRIGDAVFTMAPAELYCNYGEAGTNDWASVGADFILGNTNGATGALPDADSFHYNAGSSTYFEGTSHSHATIFPEGAGERLMETYINLGKTLSSTEKVQCECGGLAVGKPGHTCEDKVFLPWYDPGTLPLEGNYYLETDVTLYLEARTGVGERCLDLNGHTITRKVLPELKLDENGVAIPADHYYKQTRLFALEADARLTITDTAGGGKLTRDISALDAVSTEEQKKITNYGLLIAVIDGNKYGATIYKADMDASGQYSCGGACVANMSAAATFNMYDGTLTGGISDRGSVLYNSGTMNLYNAKVTGGQVMDTADAGSAAETYGSVYITASGKLLLAGNTTISGGIDSTGKENNLYVRGTLSLDPAYTGTASVTVPSEENLWNGAVFGKVGDGTTDEMLEAKLTVDNDKNGEYNITSCEGVLMAAKLRNACECGGKAAGMTDHTCKDIKWKPWPWSYNKSLPKGGIDGNYYLLTDITLETQKGITGNLHLDLNGYTITRKIDPTVEGWATVTRVFYVGDYQNTGVGSLTITDTSAEGTGKITRDLSALTQQQKESITNYGIIMLISEYADDPSALYGGVLDGSDQYTGGGAVANLSGTATFSMYGGEIKGGISRSAGSLFSYGPVKLFHGTVTGGQGLATGVGGVYIGSASQRMGRLVLGGDMVISGNLDANGEPNNISVKNGADYFTVQGAYTGTAGVILGATPYDGMKVAKSDNANIDNATFTADDYSDVTFVIEDGYIVVDMDGFVAFITAEDSTISYYETLQSAFTAYPGGKATITMLKSVAEDNLEIGKNTYLNLRGCNVANATSFNGNGNTLYVYDTKTDDYTVKVGEELTGYGIMTGAIAEAAQGVELDTELVGVTGKMDHYLKITENGDTSFHRLNLRMDSITLRADSYFDESYCPGLYYYSQFGGDEIVQRNITHYGVGMAVKNEPAFADPKSYTAFAANSWQSGMDAEGDSLNLGTSSLLTGILKTSNTYTINSRNAHVAIYGQAYVRLTDGTTLVKGPSVNYTFREILQGREGFNGVDDIWTKLNEDKQNAAVAMFDTYSQLMRGWDIPNIIGAAGYEQPTPDDDVMKILMIGHSLGMDSTHMLPDIAKKNGVEKLVVGVLYHSGCRLGQHVDYLTNNAAQYAYYEFDVANQDSWYRADCNGNLTPCAPTAANDTYINDGTIAQTMKFGIQSHDWDIVVMQAGVFEAANAVDSGYSIDFASHIKTIQDYVLENDIKKSTTPKFAWNITWTCPSDDMLNTSYHDNLYNNFPGGADEMYEAIATIAKDVIVPGYNWEYVMPSGTAMQNARSSKYEPANLYRDTIHANDYGRAIVGYVWYCTLFGKDIEECTIDSISSKLLYDTTMYNAGTDLTLTEEQKNILVESVKNALANPYAVTQSQYQ